MLHAELTGFLTAAVCLLSLLCVSLLVFVRLGTGPVVAFVFAGLVIGQLHALASDTVRHLHQIADLGVVLLLFVIGLEMSPPRLRALGRDADYRDFSLPTAILDELGVTQVRLLSNNPQKSRALADAGIEVVARISCEAAPNAHSFAYLRTKQERMGHVLSLGHDEGTKQRSAKSNLSSRA